MAFELAQLDHPHHHNLHFFPIHAQHAITHDIRTRVDTHDYALIFPYLVIHPLHITMSGFHYDVRFQLQCPVPDTLLPGVVSIKKSFQTQK